MIKKLLFCAINKDIVNGKLWKNVSNELSQLTPQNSTFLLGKTHPTEFRYHLARVHPNLDSLIEIDVKKMPRNHTLNRAVPYLQIFRFLAKKQLANKEQALIRF